MSLTPSSVSAPSVTKHDNVVSCAAPDCMHMTMATNTINMQKKDLSIHDKAIHATLRADTICLNQVKGLKQVELDGQDCRLEEMHVETVLLGHPNTHLCVEQSTLESVDSKHEVVHGIPLEDFYISVYGNASSIHACRNVEFVELEDCSSKSIQNTKKLVCMNTTIEDATTNVAVCGLDTKLDRLCLQVYDNLQTPVLADLSDTTIHALEIQVLCTTTTNKPIELGLRLASNVTISTIKISYLPTSPCPSNASKTPSFSESICQGAIVCNNVIASNNSTNRLTNRNRNISCSMIATNGGNVSNNVIQNVGVGQGASQSISIVAKGRGAVVRNNVVQNIGTGRGSCQPSLLHAKGRGTVVVRNNGMQNVGIGRGSCQPSLLHAKGRGTVVRSNTSQPAGGSSTSQTTSGNNALQTMNNTSGGTVVNSFKMGPKGSTSWKMTNSSTAPKQVSSLNVDGESKSFVITTTCPAHCPVEDYSFLNGMYCMPDNFTGVVDGRPCVVRNNTFFFVELKQKPEIVVVFLPACDSPKQNLLLGHVTFAGCTGSLKTSHDDMPVIVCVETNTIYVD